MTAFSGLVDVLRLASDEGDNSRPRRCSWEILGENPQPVRASCGVQIAPWSLFGRPDAYDYLVVVGGLLRATPEISKATLDFIRAAGGSRTTLVGCTGAFALMRAGVLDGHRVCVSWFHYWDFLEQFPQADANLLVADRLYVEDRRRITCSGGRASIDVGAAILARHVPPAAVQKALRILQVDEPGRYNAPQPQPHLPGAAPSSHPKVRRAILLMEQHLSQALTVEALAKKLDMSVRQLERLFKEDTGKSPQATRARCAWAWPPGCCGNPARPSPPSRRPAGSRMRPTWGANSARPTACRRASIARAAGRKRPGRRRARLRLMGPITRSCFNRSQFY